MKNYFEYPFDETVRDRLIKYYNDLSLDQHGDKQELKMEVKLKRVLEFINNFSKDDILLDVGCSRGFILRKLSSQIEKGIGLDISESIIRENQKIAVPENITFFSYDGVNIPYESHFSKVLMLDILEHAFSPDPLIESVHKSLKNDGVLLIEVPFSGWFSELITKIYHEGHLRYYDPQYLTRYLEARGFKVERVKTFNSVPFASILLKVPVLWKVLDWFVNLFPSKIYPYFGEVQILAKKN